MLALALPLAAIKPVGAPGTVAVVVDPVALVIELELPPQATSVMASNAVKAVGIDVRMINLQIDARTKNEFFLNVVF